MIESAGVSAVIPCRNAASTLADCLLALRSGTSAPEEIIVVDDASDDESVAVAVQAGATVLRHDRRKGPGAARNVGVAAAIQPWILFVDADVLIGGESLANARAAAVASPGGGVQGVYSPKTTGMNAATSYKHGQQLENIAGLREGPVPVMGSALALVRRSDLTAAGGFSETLKAASVEDRLLGIRLYEAGAPLRLAGNFVGEHRHRYGLVDLVRTDFTRGRDEILHWPLLGKARGYVRSRKKWRLSLFLCGLASVPFRPLGGAALIAVAVIADVAALVAVCRRCDGLWPLVSLCDQAAVVAGATWGAVLLATGRGRTS